MFTNYFEQIGLEKLIEGIKKVKLNNFVEETFRKSLPKLSEKEIKDLYIYDIPKLSPDGSCSILEEKNDMPYNLAKTFNLSFSEFIRHPELVSGSSNKEMLKQVQHDKHSLYLWRLKQVVKKLFDQTGVDWLGIYRKVKNNKGELVLVKESYLGVFSRPEFPLTAEFAKKSNNSKVGLSGNAIVINDVYAHKGAYYRCDGKVQSEFCVPILSYSRHSQPDRESQNDHRLREDDSNVVGIIDAEAFPKHFMSNEIILQIAKVAYDLGFNYLFPGE